MEEQIRVKEQNTIEALNKRQEVEESGQKDVEQFNNITNLLKNELLTKTGEIKELQSRYHELTIDKGKAVQEKEKLKEEVNRWKGEIEVREGREKELEEEI